MKKLFVMLVMLFIIYFGIQIVFNVFGTGNEVQYQINNEYAFDIYEKSTFRLPNSKDNYYFKVNVDEVEFNFQVFNDFSKKQHIITDVKYLKNDDYRCILPIFNKGEILIDALCEKNGIYSFANRINDTKINNYLKTIEGYDFNKYNIVDNNSRYSDLTVNANGLFDNYYVNLSSYKGVNTVSKNFNSVLRDFKLFDKDVYNQQIAAFYDRYYLVADYNSSYSFNKFYLIDLVSLDEQTITYHSKISFDSYVQGVVDGKVYIYDKENNKQYEVNIKNKNVSEVGNASNGIMYYDGEWSTISVTEANRIKLFVVDKNDLIDSNYSRIDKVGTEVGYYYLYKKNGNSYQVYRRNIQDDKLIYLFDTSTIDNIIYLNEVVYYIDGNKVKTYSDNYGNVTVLTYDELNFNKNINFNVHKEG